MNWTVIYKPVAEGELSDIWVEAPNRQAVTEAANHIDALLASDPFKHGESRGDGNRRIVFVEPLAVQYNINDDDRMVEVVRVRRGKIKF